MGLLGYIIVPNDPNIRRVGCLCGLQKCLILYVRNFYNAMDYRDFTDEEIKWIKSLQRCMKKAPNSLFMFVGGSCGSMTIYPKDEENNRYMEGTGVDGNAPSENIESDMEMDGGDW